MTHDRAQEKQRQLTPVGRQNVGVPGRTSRSAALTASKEPVASGMLAGREASTATAHTEKIRGTPSKAREATRSVAGTRSDLMHAVATATAPVQSLVASVDTSAPAMRIDRARQLAEANVEPAGAAHVGARMKRAISRVGTTRAPQRPLAAVTTPALERVAGAADVPALESAAAPGRSPTARVDAVKAAASRQRAAIRAAKDHGTDELAQTAAATTDPTPELAAVDSQEVTEQANIKQRQQAGVAKVDGETALAEAAATQGAARQATGGAGQAAQSHAAGAAKATANADAQHALAEQKAQQIRDAAQAAAEQARANGEADASNLRAKGAADAAQARADATQRGEAAHAQAAMAPDPDQAAKADVLRQQQIAAGAQRATEITQQAEHAAQAAIAAASRAADDLLANAEVEAHAVLDAAEKAVVTAETAQSTRQDSLFSSITASLTEVVSKVTSTLSTLAASAADKKGTLDVTADAELAQLAQMTGEQRSAITAKVAAAAGAATTAATTIEGRASAATTAVDDAEARLQAGIDVASPGARVDLLERYSRASAPGTELPLGLLDGDESRMMAETQSPKARQALLERYTAKSDEPALPLGLIDTGMMPYADPAAESALPLGLIDTRMMPYADPAAESALPLGLIDTRMVPTAEPAADALPLGLMDEGMMPYAAPAAEPALPLGLIDDRMMPTATPQQSIPTGMMEDPSALYARPGAAPELPTGLMDMREGSQPVEDQFVGAAIAAPEQEGEPKAKKSWLTDVIDKHEQGAQLESALEGVAPKDYEDTIAKLSPGQQAAARALEAEKVESIAALAKTSDDGSFTASLLDVGGLGAKDKLKDELKSLPPAMREAVIAKMSSNEDGTPSEDQQRAMAALKEAEADERSDAARSERKAKEIDNGVAATEAAVKAGNPAAVSAALDKLSGSAREKALDKLSPDARKVADDQLELREARLKKAAQTLASAADGAGTDEIAIVKTLSGLSPSEASELEDIYGAMKDGDGKKRHLKSDLLKEFDDDDEKGERAFVRAVINGDEEAKDMGVELAVKYIASEAGATFNSDEAGINDLLRANMNNPDGAKRIADAYKAKTGKDLTTQLEGIMNEAELKESTAYVENDVGRANVAVLEQKDGDRSQTVIADAKEDGTLDKLVEDSETQTGAKASQLLEDAVGKEGMAGIQGDLDTAQAKAKAKVDTDLEAARAELEADPKKNYAETVQKMTEKASKLHASLSSSGVGNDFETTELLRGLSKGEIAVLKKQYAEGNYGNLDEIVDTKLGGKDRKAVKALLTGDKVKGALAMVEQSADGVGTNVDAWKAAMETLSTEADRTEFKEECKRQGLDYQKLNKSENSGYDRDMAAAQAIEDQDDRDASVAAVKIEKAAYGGKINAINMAIDDTMGDAVGRSEKDRLEARKERRATDFMIKFSNLGTDDAAMLDAEEGLTSPRARELLDAKLKASTGKSVFEIHDEETSESTKKSLDLYAMGDMEGGQALRMIAASEGWVDDDEDGMSKGFEGKDEATRDRIRARMDEELKATGRGGIDAWQKSELSDAQVAVANDRAAEGKVNDVAAMVLAGDTTLGLGHDGAKMKELCQGKSPAEMEKFAAEFKAGGHGDLYEFMRSKASSVGEKRDVEIMIKGNYGAMPAAELQEMATKDPEKLIERVKALHEAAKGGVGKKGDLDIGNDIGNAMTDLYSDQGKILDSRLASVESMEKKLADGGKLTNAEQAELIKNVKFMSGDQTAFTDNKTKVVNAGAEVAGTIVEVGVSIGTGSDQAGTLAGGLTKMAVKANMNGARYSTDEIAQDVGKLAVELVVGKAMDTKAASALLKNPLLKEVVTGAIQGGLSAGVDVHAIQDMGQLLTVMGEGAESGALSSFASHVAGGLVGDAFGNGQHGTEGAALFDTKRAAQLNGLVKGVASSAASSAAGFDPEAPMLDQATELLKSVISDGIKGAHTGGHEHAQRQAADAHAEATHGTDDAHANDQPVVEAKADPQIAAPAAGHPTSKAASVEGSRFGDEQVNQKGKREVVASTPEGNVTASVVRDQIVVRYPEGMTNVAQRKAYAIDAAAKLGVTLHADALDRVGDTGAVPLPRKLEVRSEADVQAAARSLYDMARVQGDNPDITGIERTLRESLDPDRDPSTAPFTGKCSALSTQWQGALAEQGIYAPVMNAETAGHRYIVVGNTIIDPTIGQFGAGHVTDGHTNQYEPFVGTYPQMVARIQGQIDAGQMPQYASASEALAHGWGIHPDPSGDGFKLDSSVKPFQGDIAIVPKSVDEVRRMMDEQRAHGIPEGQGLPPDLVVQAGGGAGRGGPPKPPRAPAAMPTEDSDPTSLANQWKRHEAAVKKQAELVQWMRPDLTPEQATERARRKVVNDEVEAGLPDGETVDRTNEFHHTNEIVDISRVAAEHEKAVAHEALRLMGENLDITVEEAERQARKKVVDDEIKLGESPADNDARRASRLVETGISMVGQLSKTAELTLRTIRDVGKGDPKKAGKALLKAGAEVVGACLIACLPADMRRDAGELMGGIKKAGLEHMDQHHPDVVENAGRVAIATDKLTNAPLDLLAAFHDRVIVYPDDTSIVDRIEYHAAMVERAAALRSAGFSTEEAVSRAHDEVIEAAEFKTSMHDAKRLDKKNGGADYAAPAPLPLPPEVAPAAETPREAAGRKLAEARLKLEQLSSLDRLGEHDEPSADGARLRDQLAVAEQELAELEGAAKADKARQVSVSEQESSVSRANQDVELADIAVHAAIAEGREPSLQDLAAVAIAEMRLAEARAELERRKSADPVAASSKTRVASPQQEGGAPGAPAPSDPRDAGAEEEIQAEEEARETERRRMHS